MAAEIVLIDVDKKKAEGEVMDLIHAAPFAQSTRVWVGDYEDCAGAAIVILTAGANQKPGESRTQLVEKNYEIFKSIVPEVAKHAKDAIIIVSANPVDVMTWTAAKLSGFPAHRVIGSGTSLDSARFATELARQFGIDSTSVHAIIIGEHGDSEIPVWSLTTVAGMKLDEYSKLAGLKYGKDEAKECFERTKNAAGEIIERKGVTGYGIASSLVRIIQAVLMDQNTVMTVSAVGKYAGVDDDIALSVCRKVNREGCKELVPLQLDADEKKGLKKSAKKMAEIIRVLRDK